MSPRATPQAINKTMAGRHANAARGRNSDQFMLVTSFQISIFLAASNGAPACSALTGSSLEGLPSAVPATPAPAEVGAEVYWRPIIEVVWGRIDISDCRRGITIGRVVIGRISGLHCH